MHLVGDLSLCTKEETVKLGGVSPGLHCNFHVKIQYIWLLSTDYEDSDLAAVRHVNVDYFSVLFF